MRTADRVSVGVREEASMVVMSSSSPSFRDAGCRGFRVVEVVDVEVDGDGGAAADEEIVTFALTSAATLVSIFNAFSV